MVVLYRNLPPYSEACHNEVELYDFFKGVQHREKIHLRDF